MIARLYTGLLKSVLFQITLIKGYDGDKTKLGNAEKFYLLLSDLPGYKTRIEGMVLKDEFRVTMETLVPNVETIIRASRSLMENESLKVFLRFVLQTGNFLNAVGILKRIKLDGQPQIIYGHPI